MACASGIAHSETCRINDLVDLMQLAIAPRSPRADEPPRLHGSPGSGQTSIRPLCGLLRAEAERDPDRVLLREQPGHARWSGRRDQTWTVAEAERGVGALAALLLALKLRPGALVGLCLTGASCGVLAMLAVEEAGLTPFFMPLTGNWADLARIIDASGIRAVITQARAGGERPAERLSEIAAGYFQLRFLMAFGPDVPDGVVDLDAVLESTPSHTLGAHGPPFGSEPGIVTLPRLAASAPPVFRPSRSLIAASARVFVPGRIRAGDRLISLIAPDDLKGLALGPVMALLSRANLEIHGVFDAASLHDSLECGGRSHLVAPGWMEPLLARLDLPTGLETIILVHQAPVRFCLQATLGSRVVDVLSFDEIALIANARTPGGLFALSLDAGPSPNVLADLLSVRIDEDAALSFGGPAAIVADLQGGALPDLRTLPRWRGSCFKADLFAGIVIGVS